MRKKFKSCSMILLLLVLLGLLLSGCAEKKRELVMADAGWDSVKVHNAVAGFIAKSAYGFSGYREVSGTSTVLHEGLLKGEVDLSMEEWTDNLATYQADLAENKFQELGVNYDDNVQGFYVPRYVVEGDPSRGIAPIAPDLKSVQDLKNYPELFPDDEQKNKGRIYGAIPGWEIDSIMYKKYEAYGLDQNFIYFRPGSEPALTTSFTSAYEKGQPVVGYYWEPTWIMGKYDFVLLEDAPYDPQQYQEGKTACPSVRVMTAASNKFAQEEPEFCSFVKNYRTSSALTSEALAHMQDTGENHEETAKWFLKEHDELLDDWLPEDKANKVRSALGTRADTAGQNWLWEFPFKLPVDVTAVDRVVRAFSARFDGFFSAVKNGLTGMISGVETLLNFIPWWLLMIAVLLGGWKISKKWRVGILYMVMLCFIGLFGLWSLMNETLAIVAVSVLISLIIGFPVGILIAGNDKANRVFRPILDTMQTMPVFVYLIPAILFFGLGKAPAVIATTIYAVVPMIRLTSHGIRQVDPEVVEAARAFGSTKLQSLIKVQIPQALPTIMTGVNQTLMMSMAMVVTCSMIGASGLGMEVLIGVNRIEIGRGLVAGIAVVVLAILIDRFTQGAIRDSEVKADGK